MADPNWGPEPGGPRPASLGRYSLGVVITALAVLSQYFVPPLVPGSQVIYGNLPGALAVVYGIPLVSFALLVGRAPLRDWNRRMGLATWQGLRFYGLLMLLALLIVFVLTIVYEILDPSALQLLERTPPPLQQASGDPWFWVGFSFAVGAIEETIFRGFIFGYWRDRPGSWIGPAAWTSAVFAGVHLYYGITYGPASPLVYPSLFLLGFAFAATYRFSGGNLVVPALLHGAHDALAFLEIVSRDLAVILSYLLILVGAVIGLVQYLRNDRTPLAPLGPPNGSG
ncbi:MAG TPA: CPBP family intramembrane glutamic endopeptidase [Thermoplasmata archaeon]|nr:CPBP family intramembrane glutamic endopeptidase [Thermoplasmata archaeon]